MSCGLVPRDVDRGIVVPQTWIAARKAGSVNADFHGAAAAIGRRVSGNTHATNTHRTLIVFTAHIGCRPRLVLYSRGTVDLRGAGKTRRWQSAIAIVAALSLFVALIAGSALRPQFAAAALPEPAAWSQGALDADACAYHVELHGRSHSTSRVINGASCGTAPTKHKPFHSMWMTKDRPATWTRLSSQWVWSPLPASFAVSDFQPGGTHNGSPADTPGNQDILTEICVARC